MPRVFPSPPPASSPRSRVTGSCSRCTRSIPNTISPNTKATARKSEQYGSPSESVKIEKQRHASKTALDYLRLLDNPQIHWRFDIVEVILRDGARKPDDIRLIQNAFDLSEPFIY